MEIAVIPGWALLRWSQDERTREHLNVLCSTLLVLFAVVLLSSHPSSFRWAPHLCLFQVLFHLPCPGCGVTSSMTAALHGELGRAWQLQPVGVLFLVFLLMQVPLRSLALMKGPRSETLARVSRLSSHALVALLLFVWVGRIL